GPWKALSTALAVWLWTDAVFAGVHQQIALLCGEESIKLCGLQPAYSQSLDSFGSALYFSTMTLATVGYGDIAPLAPVARATASLEVFLGIGLLGFILARVAGFAMAS